MYRHILVPVDGSALSEYAIPFGIEIARRAGGRVKLMRAMSLSVDAPASLPSGVRLAAQGQVDGLRREWGGAEVPIVAEVRAGTPVDEILHADRRSDLIVMTVHGGGGIVPSSAMTTRFGPTGPRCSQIEADPGPPLHTKHTGRPDAFASSRRYDVVNTAASGSPRLSSSPPAVTGTNSATAR